MLLEIMKRRIPSETNEELLQDFLNIAGSMINIRRQTSEVEEKYKYLQVEIAIELYNKMGAEGQSSHSENGVNRAYMETMVSRALLSQIVPRGVVICATS